MERLVWPLWGLIVAIVLGVVAVLMLASHQPKLDADLCPQGGTAPPGHAIVLVDETDGYSSQQASDLKDFILDLRDRLPRYRRLSVMLIESKLETPPRLQFSLCNPGRAGQVNGLIETDRSKRLFDAPLDLLLGALKTQTTQPKSPILQTIAEVSHLPNFQDGPRELDIVSDLMENSALLTQYHHPMPFDAFATSPRYAEAAAALQGVSLRLLYLRRPGTEAVQDENQRAFWIAYFRHSGARDVSWCGVGSATASRKEVTCEPALN